MTRWENYMNAAEKVITGYDGSIPLHHYLKTFFKVHPHMGSRDRRWVQQLVYQYFRPGRWQNEQPVKERILLGVFLCAQGPDELLAFFRPAWNELAAAPLEQKLATTGVGWNAQAAFPFLPHLSAGIDGETFTRAHLQQPHLFIRARPGKMAAILRLLDAAGVAVQPIGEHALALPNGTKTDSIIPDKSWYEVQDLSSQETGLHFHAKAGEHWWDCCAASGGKSILLLDKEPAVHLFASDVRASILENLKKRFAEAGVKNYSAKVLDLTAPTLRAQLPRTRFDGIILDAPCSGSGTWGRTPENIRYFKESQIAEYARLQKEIAANVTPFLQPGGTLVYITCSVFREENEEAVEYLRSHCGLEITESGVIGGYERGADTMFVAVGKKP
ncbi:RNA methyltransferase [Chitinophaga alhagiae]|uniref:RNA methyltransferase n=1 Tax=Chitinophaga alhagiae TaxID=2203219 RepID=A0ABM6WA15_9BACT|nr:RsmB/NOP family class I SAM-dependent RNA methyltransferase [Chitinophaga alhagiae]AWO00724.1 RNA methyltransferase [Chitinophaga alhagiae]